MIRLKPSQMTTIRANLKEKGRPLRVCRCFRCGFLLAARSIEELESVAWEVTINGLRCETCANEKAPTVASLLPAGAIPFVGTPVRKERGHAENDAALVEKFNSLPLAPADAFPKVGGRGERHWQTSRPEE